MCLYVLAAALMPLGHHDIVCHLKSTTHCTTCVVGASADLASDSSPLAGCGLDDAGSAVQVETRHFVDLQVGPSAGRAPPAL